MADTAFFSPEVFVFLRQLKRHNDRQWFAKNKARYGTSRFGSGSRRGHGFRPIFVGLANLRGSLRFRTGDHALVIDGTSPSLATAQLAQKPFIDSFFASVRCHNGTGRTEVPQHD